MIKVRDRRMISEEGFLLADSILTQTGELEYTRGELGLDGDPSSLVKLKRSRKVLETALPKMIGTAVTRGHPDSFVDSGNTEEIIGAVVTEPKIDDDGKVRAKVRIYDKHTIEGINRGEDQLSPGFNFVLRNFTGDSGDIEKMSINHIAVLPNGRAGHSVRILDHLPPERGPKEKKMSNDEMNEMIRKAVDESIRGLKNEPDPNAIVNGLVAAVSDALKQPLADIKELKDAQIKAVEDAAKKKAEDEAEAGRRKIIDEVTKAERERYSIIDRAKPFISEDLHSGLIEKSAKEILVMAIGDSIPEVENLPIETLHGVLLGMTTQFETQDENPKGLRRKTNEKDEEKLVDIYAERFKNRHQTSQMGA